MGNIPLVRSLSSAHVDLRMQPLKMTPLLLKSHVLNEKTWHRLQSVGPTLGKLLITTNLYPHLSGRSFCPSSAAGVLLVFPALARKTWYLLRKKFVWVKDIFLTLCALSNLGVCGGNVRPTTSWLCKPWIKGSWVVSPLTGRSVNSLWTLIWSCIFVRELVQYSGFCIWCSNCVCVWAPQPNESKYNNKVIDGKCIFSSFDHLTPLFFFPISSLVMNHIISLYLPLLLKPPHLLLWTLNVTLSILNRCHLCLCL